MPPFRLSRRQSERRCSMIRSQSSRPILPVYSDVRLYGTRGDGQPDDQPAIQAAFDSGSSVFIPPGNYNLTTNAVYATVADSDGHVVIDPRATMADAKINVAGLIPRQTGPIYSLDAQRKYYGTGFPSSWGNVYQFARTAIVGENGPGRVVAIYAMGEAKFTGKTAWAFNPVAYASVSGANAIMIEGNAGVLASGATAYGNFLSVSGSGAIESAFQLSGNDPGAVAKKLLYVDNGDQNMVTESILESGALTTARGLYWRGTFGTAEIDIPALLVNPGGSIGARLVASPVNNTNYRLGIAAITQSGGTPATDTDLTIFTLGTGKHRFRTNGSSGPLQLEVLHVASATEWLTLQGSTTANPIIGTTTDSGSANRIISVRGAGTGGVRLQNSTTTRFEVNSTGVGFFGATPVARSTGWAADSGVARLDALITYLLSRGDLAA